MNKELGIYLKEAAKARKERNFKQALEFLKQAYSIDSNNLSVLIETAMFNKDKGQYNMALEIFKNCLDSPKRNICLMEIGSIYLKFNDLSTAEYYFYTLINETKLKEDSIYTFKDLVFPLQRLALYYRIHKNYSEAEKLYKEILQLCESRKFVDETNKCYALLELGNIQLLYGNCNNALDYYEQLAATNLPDRYLALLEIAKIKMNNRDFNEAREILRQIISANNYKTINKAIYTLGKLEFYEQNFQEAFNLFTFLLNTKDHPLALEQIMYLNYKCENYELALENMQEVLNHLNKKKFNQQKNEEYKLLKKVILLKLGQQKEKNNTLLDLFDSYSKEKAIENIRYYQNRQKHKKLNYNLDYLLENIDLNKADYFGTTTFDIYYFHLENTGTIFEKETDFLKIATIPNTYNIVGVYPIKSKNNQLHKEDISLRRIYVENN